MRMQIFHSNQPLATVLNFIACALIVFVLGTTSLRGATRVALVGGDGGNHQINKALDLATVQLSSDAKIALLERSEIDRVLSEQNLSLSGLVDAETVVRAGKLLAVDLFAVVESVGEGKEALGLVVFDAPTALRLADETLDADTVAAAGQVAAAVRGSLAKRHPAQGRLRPVCLLSVRNADLPREMDSVCQSAGLLLERGLLKAPNVAVLERKRLQHVNEERRLTGSPNQDLWTSLVLIELELGRDGSGKGIRGAALLTDADGKLLQKITAELAQQDFVRLSRSLQEQVAAALGQKLPSTSADPLREAERFAHEAAMLHAHGDFQAAVNASEAACALAPDHKDYRDALIRYLLDNGNDLLMPPGRQNVPANFTDQPDADTVNLATAQLSRAVDLRRDAFQEQNPFDYQRLGEHRRKFFATDHHALGPVLKRFAHMRPKTDKQRRELAQVRAKFRAHFLESAQAWAKAAETNPDAMTTYTSMLSILWLDYAAYFSNSGEAYIEDVIRLTEQWLRAKAVAGPTVSRNRSSELQGVMAGVMEPQLRFLSSVFGLQEADYANRLAGTLDAMRQHPHPVIRTYGEIGQLWRRKMQGHLSLEELDAQFKRVMAAALERSADPEPWPARQTRVEMYTALVDAIRMLYEPSGPGMWSRYASARVRQLLSLSESMVERGDVSPRAVHIASRTLRTIDQPEAHQPRLLEVVDGMQALVDHPEAETFGESREGLRASLKKLQIELHPKGLAAASRRWSKAHKLFDVSQVDRIAEIKRGVVSGRTMYCVGLESRSGSAASQAITTLRLLAVPVDGSQPKKLGAIPKPTGLPWSYNSIRDVAVGTHEFVAAVDGAGAAIFPLDGTTARTLDESSGLPTRDVQSVAVLGRKLYAGLGSGGYLVTCDLDSDRTQIVASASRRDQVSPLDNTGNLRIPCLIPDVERQRVLFVADVNRLGSRRDERNGIWQIDGDTGELRQLQRLYLDVPIRWASEPIGGRVLFGGTGFLLSYDYQAKEVTVLRSLFAREFAPNVRWSGKRNHVSSPFAAQVETMWSTFGFSRVTNAMRDLLMPLEPEDNRNAHVECVHVFPEGQRMLVATRSSAWLLDYDSGDNRQ